MYMIIAYLQKRRGVVHLLFYSFTRNFKVEVVTDWKLEITIFSGLFNMIGWRYSSLRLRTCSSLHVSQRFTCPVSLIYHNEGTQTQQEPTSTPGSKIILWDIILFPPPVYLMQKWFQHCLYCFIRLCLDVWGQIFISLPFILRERHLEANIKGRSHMFAW
jgi:hypothetical protein